MSFKKTEACPIYQLALKATQEIDPPAAGFEKPPDSGQLGPSISKLIKQNNLIIQLLVSVSEQLQSCQEDIRRLDTASTSKGKQADPEFEVLLTELQSKLEKLDLGHPLAEKPRKPPTPFYVFKDPKIIFEQEKAKLRNQ